MTRTAVVAAFLGNRYNLIFGVMLIVLAFRLRGMRGQVTSA